ncbi:hypothetical protein N0B16_06655 [Chryseobacterium sp. GMJ5]|uniref:Uncharacterized protein n=1 Tax=Chryseobacterium gilvum TaxID=2976534 RepID=A0ABT2VVT6_9FLAO|nr:hypothetical protein [Chryseobacterium gilvum]MCU7614113.1 hypothetical protein [Chryseobacterium gilvum]
MVDPRVGFTVFDPLVGEREMCSFSASSSCENPFSSRYFLILFPMVAFMAENLF